MVFLHLFLKGNSLHFLYYAQGHHKGYVPWVRCVNDDSVSG